MSISDLVDDGTFDLVAEGDGYSVAHEKDSQRWRADVWGADFHCSWPTIIASPEGMRRWADDVTASATHRFGNDQNIGVRDSANGLCRALKEIADG